MQASKHILAGVGIAAIATALVSFSGEKSSKKDDEKKKKYHVIHQENGEMHQYDTIISMTSDYTVQDFLASKGIDDPNVKIIEIPTLDGVSANTKNGKEKRVMMFHIDEEFDVQENDGTREEIKIIRKKDDNGKVTMKKFVNGTEVEVTEEDMEQMHHRHGKEGEHHAIIIKEEGDGIEWTSKDGEENVEIKVETDDKGNTQIQKFVNGEKVQVSEEEMEQIQQGNNQVFIIDEEQIGDMEMEIEMIEENDMEEGQQRVIIKEIRMDSETISSDSDEINKDVRVENHVEVNGEDEDFTVVLVHENYDETMEENVDVRVQSERTTGKNQQDLSLNAPISVYPNPNNGTFTIAFEQKNKATTSIRVVDTQGKVVFKEKLGDFSGAYKKELDLKKHGVGAYIVTVHQGDETSSRKVIVE